MKIIAKRIISVLTGVCLLFACFSASIYAYAPFDKEFYYGDIDDNNVINAEDALFVLKHAAKLEIIEESMIERADVDDNDLIDAADALEILRFSATLIDGFPADNQEPTPTPMITRIPDPEATEKADVVMPDDFSGKVWIFGDSIAAYHTKDASIRPLYGWGEVIGDYFNGVSINNHAVSSQSTSSYYNLCKNTYDYVFYYMNEKDYVFISFGHNDHNPALLNYFDRTTDPDASTDTEYSYKWWLKNYYIDPVLEKGAVPILMSSVVRWIYEDGVFTEFDIHMKYGKAMEELVAEYAEQGITVYYIDAQDYTYNLYSSMKASDAMLFHGQYGGEGRGFFDNTHYSEAGARMISDFIVSELKKTDLSIVELLKPEFAE